MPERKEIREIISFNKEHEFMDFLKNKLEDYIKSKKVIDFSANADMHGYKIECNHIEGGLFETETR